jgi:hypothetical protein
MIYRSARSRRTAQTLSRAGVAALIVGVTSATVVIGAAPAGAAVTPAPGDPLTGSGATGRSGLYVADLTTGSSTGAVSDAHFALPPQAAAPAHTFEGRLELQNEATSGGFTELRDDYSYTSRFDSPRKHLPEVNVELVQNGSHLIPVQQGLIITGHQNWNFIVGPGRAWRENGDSGWSRASLPFALVQRNANCTHNGTLTFLFTNTSISKVRYQVTAETCVYFRFTMWGQLSASAPRYAVAGAEGLKNAHAAEVGARLPTKPISALATDYPTAGLDLSKFGAGIAAADMSTYGVLYNGVNYIAGCATRQGTYPYCEQLRVPSYSTAKSAFAGVAYMRLGQKYNDAALGNRLVRTYVSEVQSRSSWNTVTINNTLDMATGHYDDPGDQVDEARNRMENFFLAEPYADKMSYATAFPYKQAPGTRWVYHTSDTFIATRAMQNYAGTDLFNLVRDEVYVPAKLSKGAQTSLRTDNGAGMAFGGYGMFWTQDDIAKVAKLLNNDGGVAGGTQQLRPDFLAGAMQRDPSDRGLDTTGSVPFKYNNHFWARQFGSAQGFSCSFWVPFMSGYGGITVAMMPNGATYYYFSDSGTFTWQAAVQEAHKLRQHC